MKSENELAQAIDWTVRERLAEQLVAVMGADWFRPTPEQMLKVLLSAQWRVEAMPSAATPLPDRIPPQHPPVCSKTV